MEEQLVLDLNVPTPKRADCRVNDIHRTLPVRIFLDEVEQRNVIAFDVEAGTLVRYMVDPLGRIMTNDAKDDALTETLTGTVRVEWDADRLPEPNEPDSGPIFEIMKEFKRTGCNATQRAMAAEIHKLRKARG